MYYSANWQLLEERIDENYVNDPDVDREIQYVWGIRYIDDLIARQENLDVKDDSPTVTYDNTYYHLTDAQFSTVAVLDHAAEVIERVSYDPHGTARHRWPHVTI